MCIHSEKTQGAVQMMRSAQVCIKDKVGRANYPQTGNTVPYYLFDYGSMENITWLLFSVNVINL